MSRNASILAAGATAIVIALVVGFRLVNPDGTNVGGPATPPSGTRPSQSASPTPASSIAVVTGLPGRFAFAAHRTGKFEIYSMKPDRSELVQLTNDPGDDREPAWSPDGTKIAFTRSVGGKRAIWTMNADGSGATRLAYGGTPHWAPDGRRIVAQADDTIFVINADGTGRADVIVERTIGLLINGPSWSVDGSRILFIGSPGEGKGSDVYSVALDGTDLRKLTSTLNEEATPLMSPDGRRIAYVTQYTCICAMNADGSSPTTLAAWSGKGASLSWSPDSKWLASAGGSHGPLYIHVVNADRGEDMLATDTGDYAEISWGP